jgi:hypothetical protein
VEWTVRRHAQLPGAGDSLGPIRRAELGQDVADVLLDRVQGDYKLASDGLIRPPGREHSQDLDLAAGQRVDDAGEAGIRRGLPRVEGPLQPGQLAERDASDLRRVTGPGRRTG